MDKRYRVTVEDLVQGVVAEIILDDEDFKMERTAEMAIFPGESSEYRPTGRIDCEIKVIERNGNHFIWAPVVVPEKHTRRSKRE